MPRGGRRAGAPGKAYSNRTDLNRTVPISAPTGQAYGARAEQIAAQRAIPIARPATDSVPVAPGPVAGGAAGLGGATSPGPAVPPRDVTPLGAPTDRPDEPVTAGVPVGPGPGPEIANLLEDDNGAKDLAMYLPMLEFMASQPGASSQTRNFVRRLRGAAPVI